MSTPRSIATSNTTVLQAGGQVQGLDPRAIVDQGGRSVNGGELEAIPLGGLADVESDWSRLAESAGSPFLTWEWASTWWRHFGAGELRLVGCRAEGRLLAILPLYRGAGRVRALRFLGHGHAGELGPVCDPRDAPEALEALVRYLRDGSTGWDVFLA